MATVLGMDNDEILLAAEAKLARLTAALAELIPDSAAPEQAMAGLECLYRWLADVRRRGGRDPLPLLEQIAPLRAWWAERMHGRVS